MAIPGDVMEIEIEHRATVGNNGVGCCPSDNRAHFGLLYAVCERSAEKAGLGSGESGGIDLNQVALILEVNPRLAWRDSISSYSWCRRNRFYLSSWCWRGSGNGIGFWIEHHGNYRLTHFRSLELFESIKAGIEITFRLTDFFDDDGIPQPKLRQFDDCGIGQNFLLWLRGWR